jgi:hypothetical protein
VKLLTPIEEIHFIWDRFLPKDEVKMDMNGLWHIGVGTDLSSLVFQANLTTQDMDFLGALKVKI